MTIKQIKNRGNPLNVMRTAARGACKKKKKQVRRLIFKPSTPVVGSTGRSDPGSEINPRYYMQSSNSRQNFGREVSPNTISNKSKHNQQKEIAQIAPNCKKKKSPATSFLMVDTQGGVHWWTYSEIRDVSRPNRLDAYPQMTLQENPTYSNKCGRCWSKQFQKTGDAQAGPKISPLMFKQIWENP